MGLQFDLTTAVSMQQTIDSPGEYDGSHVGRATADLGSGGALVRIRAREFGSDGNSISIEFYDAGAPNIVLTTTVQIVSLNVIKVNLRRSAGAILATADEVADAINNFRVTLNPSQKLPIVAHPDGTSVVTAIAATLLSGGLDPEIVAPMVKFTTTDNGGLFYFDQTEPLVILQMECNFTGMAGPTVVSFQMANLDPGLEVIPAETAELFNGTVDVGTPYISFVDSKIIFLPRQAFLIVASGITGVARIVVERLETFLKV